MNVRAKDIFCQYPKVLEALLRDHTTRENIFWATDSYADLGRGYSYDDPITPDHILNKCEMILRPRSQKSRNVQTERTKGMAEVSTPSWVCNIQNNLVDESWFGRSDVFNTVNEDEHSWQPTSGKIIFPEDKNWKSYVRATRMEITCGEAPYLVSRYDTTTGESIELPNRIGMLDRKLRVVSENTDTSGEWLEMTQEAYKNIYGFEWQGDSLFLARESMLLSFLEYYFDKFGKMPLERSIRYIAYIISWNVWQMDGMKGVVPGSCEKAKKITSVSLFGDVEEEGECIGCQRGGLEGHRGVYCNIRDWGRKDPKTGKNNRIIRFVDLAS